MRRVLFGISLVLAAPLFAGDCNRNGIADAVDIETTSSTDCNGNAIPDECELAPVVFAPRGDHSVARIPRVTVAADFNRDGLTDLATGNQDSDRRSSISVLLSRGGGTFDPAVHFDAGSSLFSMTSADIDGDGDMDVVTANLTSILVLENAGDGTFSESIELPVARGSRFVTASDVTGDGIPDLVAASARADTVSVLENETRRSFGRAVSYSVGAHPTSIATADLDGDGNVDLATSNRDSGDVSILMGRGDGSFDGAVQYQVTGAHPFSVLAAELNGDDRCDLAAASPTGVSLLLNDGGGDFGPSVSYVASPASFTSGDLDGDGDIDLGFGSAETESVTVLLNDGTGRLSAVDFWLPRVRWGLCAADLDGDGDVDLAASRMNPDRITVLWNGNGGTLSFHPPEAYSAGGDPHSLDLGDLDGDGDLDVVTGNNNEGFSVLTNRGDGTFARARIHHLTGFSLSMAAGDFDRDGDIDLASADHRSRRLQVLRQNGDGDFQQVDSYPLGVSPYHLAEGDLDGDGFLDLVTANDSSDTVSILFNSGDGRFGRTETIRVGSAPVATVVADLHGDGEPDLAVANQSSSEISVLENRGDGTLAQPVFYATPGRPSFVAAADLDLDGLVDLVTSSETESSLYVFWNAGGALGPPVRISAGRRPYSLVVADLNRDRTPDLVTANSSRDTLSILVGERDRVFAPPVELPVGSQPRSVVAGDLDADGAPDLVSANHHSADITVLLNDPPRSLGGEKDFLETICTEREFHTVTVASERDGPTARVGKYVLPARDDPRLLPTVFQNARRYPLHEDFLAAAAPERFERITREEYNDIVGRRATRDYYVGTLTRLPGAQGGLYTFTIVADTGFHSDEALTLDEIQWVYARLRTAFRLAPLHYHPDTALARRKVEETWPVPSPLPVYLPEGRPDVRYEAYSLGTAYGHLRLLTLEEFEDGGRRGLFTFQDIVVVDEAPREVEGVVGGLITAQPQGELSHVAIRLARQGVPNAFVAGALQAFASYDGKLVRLQVCEGGYTSDEQVSEHEAVEFWTRTRPVPPELPAPDETYPELDHVLEIDIAAVDGVPPEARFGGKASNFARLQHLLVGDLEPYREPGFGIPMRYYFEFMRTNFIAVGGRELTYEEYLFELFATPGFQTDSEVRSQALRRFRALARERGIVDPALVTRLTERIARVFGQETRMVRFRSSSNVEDALASGGAGLYDSTSACAADTLRGEPPAGSHCDPSRKDARTIERALKKVWTSLWTFRAFEERAYFQIPQEKAAMGILVTRAFLDESANGVAFTGDPRNGRDRRYVITAQIGEESVVSPEPGVAAERDLLHVVDGEVVEIFRERRSSLVGPGETVLTDAHLRELGALMWHIAQEFPIEVEGQARREVLLDFEFKIEPDGSLAVKQVRPFLLSGATPKSPTFELEIAAGTTVCGVFSKEHVGRSLDEEYEAKSTVRFAEGTYELPAGSSSFAAALFEEVRFGRSQEIASPAGPGTFRAVTIPTDCSETTYRFDYGQRFTLSGGESLEIRVFGLDFKGQAERAFGESLRIDEGYLTYELSMQGFVMGEPVVSYSSCTYELLPLWVVDVELERGSYVTLHERFLPSENDISTGPASLVRAEVGLEGASRTVTDYWRLVYAAERHNRHPRYRIILDPPLDVTSVGAPVHAVELAAPEPGTSETGTSDDASRVLLLGEAFEILARRRIVSFTRSTPGDPEAILFRRGDVNGDAMVTGADAIRLLEFLLLRGLPPGCAKAADADDNGRLNLSDAVRILAHLFADEESFPGLFAGCGADPTPDRLECEVAGTCGSNP